jgi:hypothetical protein
LREYTDYSLKDLKFFVDLLDEFGIIGFDDNENYFYNDFYEITPDDIIWLIKTKSNKESLFLKKKLELI